MMIINNPWSDPQGLRTVYITLHVVRNDAAPGVESTPQQEYEAIRVGKSGISALKHPQKKFNLSCLHQIPTDVIDSRYYHRPRQA